MFGIMKLFILVSLLSIGCGADKHVTSKGEVGEDMSRAFCERAAECGILAESRIDECVRHSVHHSCELDESCGDAIAEDLGDNLGKCLEDFSAQDCFLIAWGVVPESCLSLF